MMNSLISAILEARKNLSIAIVLAGYILNAQAFSQKPTAGNLMQQLENHKKEDTVRVNLLIKLSHHYYGVDQHKSLIHAEKALKLAEKIGFQKGIAYSKNQLASSYHMVGKDETAIKYALSAEALAEKLGLHAITAESHRTLAIVYMDQEDLNGSEKYFRKVEHYARQFHQNALLAKILNGLGTLQLRKKNSPEALRLFEESLVVAKKVEMPFYMALILSNMGETYGTTFYRNTALQEKYYVEALFHARKGGNKFAETTILANLGKMMITKGKLAEAEKHLQQALAMAEKLELKLNSQKIYLNLVNLSLKQNNFEKANQYIQKYYAFRNGLMNEERSKQIVRLEEQYKSEKREQKIKLLEQEKRLQIASKNFWLIGSIFLFLTIIIIYALLQSRNQKASQLLEVQKTFIEKLKETDLLKSRFFANISHEFRTPLSLIIAPLEELQASTKFKNAQKELRTVSRNANRLLDLVNQLLDLSKLEAGKMTVQIENGNLLQWLRILAASFDSLAEIRKISFTKDINVPFLNTWYDADKLEKIVANMLSNAFKFTGPGGLVSLSVQTSSDTSEITITLTDTGKGISESDLPHVFSPFYQSRHTVGEGQPGTGLGLALVSELVKLHKGTIDFRSKVDVGTKITVTLPISREKLDFAEIVEAKASVPFTPKITVSESQQNVFMPDNEAADCLLVVEDNRDLRDFIAGLFRDTFRVLTAVDGEQGLEMALEHVPDLIISDIMMPKMNGIELAENVKNNNITSHIPMLLLTAKSDSESRMEGLRTGADDYLAKPFSTEELRVRVSNLIATRKKLAAKYRTQMHAPVVEERILSADEKFVIVLRAVVEAHLSDFTFSVEQLAEEMCLSRTQLFRKVKALLEISPNELINDIRLQRAATLIRSKADSLTQISYSVGFSEQSYFAKRFRKKYGVSPSEYANSSFSAR